MINRDPSCTPDDLSLSELPLKPNWIIITHDENFDDIFECRGQMLNFTSLEAWMGKSNAPAIEHTQTLYQQIKRSGFKIFLISTRRESLRDATVDNLIKAGYHGWSGLVLRGLDDEYKSVKSYKAEARKKLVNEGYRIWGIIGDQWSSFHGSPSAKRTFKLPNSMYYVS